MRLSTGVSVLISSLSSSLRASAIMMGCIKYSYRFYGVFKSLARFIQEVVSEHSFMEAFQPSVFKPPLVQVSAYNYLVESNQLNEQCYQYSVYYK